MRCARTLYEPAARSRIWNSPVASVTAPRVLPTMLTCAPSMRRPVAESVTVPRMVPVLWAIDELEPASSSATASICALMNTDLQRFMRRSSFWREGGFPEWQHGHPDAQSWMHGHETVKYAAARRGPRPRV